MTAKLNEDTGNSLHDKLPSAEFIHIVCTTDTILFIPFILE